MPITVPPNPALRGARRQAIGGVKKVAKAAADSQALPSLTHLYQVGERLRLLGGSNLLARDAASCEVLFQLPYEGQGPIQYRVRSETEAFDRVVAQGDLRPLLPE